jgi:glycosyltransferase involved in cell wall biosynthesis
MRLLFLVRRAGPYHDARYEAAGGLLDLTVAETRPQSREYPWSSVAGARNYRLAPFGVASNPEVGLRGDELQKAVNRCFEAAKPDVIACTGWADREYHAAVRRAHSLGVPAIVMSDSTYDDEPRTWWKERLKRPLIRGFAAAVVAGGRSRSYLRDLGFAPDAIFEPCDVVDNGHFADQPRRVSGVTCPPPGPYFLCVSRYLPKKNLFRLVQAFSAYRRLHVSGGWDLVILGSGELEKELAAAIEAAGVASQVHRPGFVQYDDLPSFYAGAGACVLPSLSDQWGLAVNEAMAAGLPVIVSTACGCAADLVVDGENGFLFDARDDASLTRLMERMATLADPERVRMGAAGRSRIARYTPHRFAEALVAAATRARIGFKPPSLATRMALGASALRK